MPFTILGAILLGVGIAVVAYLIAPQPKLPKPPEAQDLDEPTAEAGRPIPVVWGEITVTGTNVLWYGDKELVERKVKA
jgi:hypothetical protein